MGSGDLFDDGEVVVAEIVGVNLRRGEEAENAGGGFGDVEGGEPEVELLGSYALGQGWLQGGPEGTGVGLHGYARFGGWKVSTYVP